MATTLVARWENNTVVLCQQVDKKVGWLPVGTTLLANRGTHPAALLASLERVVFQYHVDADAEEVTVLLVRGSGPEIARATYVRSGTHAEAVQGQRVRMAHYSA